MRWPFTLVCTLVLSGCIASEPQGSTDESSQFATAKELRDFALEEAQRWEPNARLNLVMALENEVPRPNDDNDMSRLVTLLGAVPDPETGDGLAARWLFYFASGSGDAEEEFAGYLVVVNQSKGIVLSREATEDEQYVVPFSWMQSWTIDSDDAAQRAQNLSPRWGGSDEPTAVVWTLMNLPRDEEGQPDLFWSLAVRFSSDEDAEYIGVHAESGEAWFEQQPPEGV